MFAEHSHRLSGGTMGLITLGLTVWLALVESRPWVRKLGWWALAIVVVQGLIGGQRVKLDGWHLAGMEMSVGQLLRIPHGILAQIFVVILFAISAALSRPWIEAPPTLFHTRSTTRRLGVFCTGLVLLQLVIATTMRHSYAGLAIPTFPFMPDGRLIPSDWNFRVAIHFAHRVMAGVLGLALVWYAICIWTERGISSLLRNTAGLMVTTLLIQIALGAAVIWSLRDPYFTTGHVMVGAWTLAITFLLTWFCHRNTLEGTSREISLPATLATPARQRMSASGSSSSPA
jgi:heme a synthase